MATKVVLPKWGMGIEEGMIVRWLKTIGDTIEKGEPLVEIETAKATQEMEAPVGGRLVQILLPAGQTATVNTEIAVIDETYA
ncbi:biotin/lipoyl-containing protein [Steroidobacter flavus]|uniref:Biotin/lipoyl-containing protein n=1 Tax=Steroidobacter flavus TaxID=1842136 RepID=A0ABV8SWY5_9GAMM